MDRLQKHKTKILITTGFIFTIFLLTFAIRKPQVYINETIIPADTKSWMKTGKEQLGTNKAVLLIICKNDDLYETKKTIREMEDRFNKKFHYPYLILNDQPFSSKFIEEVAFFTESKIEFDLIPDEHWKVPKDIDMKMVQKNMDRMKDVVHGFFYNHPKILKYDYYWRVESGSQYHCDLDEDPFNKLVKEDKDFSFVMSMYEDFRTIKTLWTNVQRYINQPGITLAKNNSLKFISDDEGSTYNTCHFWTNFELGSLKFFRSKDYEDFFQYLDKTGGFFYERWGDAPIHTIAVSLFLDRSKILFFNEIGYSHSSATRCPQEPIFLRKCSCWREDSFDLDTNFSCFPRWQKFISS